MCLALPARVVALLPDDRARVEMDGVIKEISVALVEGLAIGDYVILHVGHALARLDTAEAEATLALLAELAGQTAPGPAPTPAPTPAPSVDRPASGGEPG